MSLVTPVASAVANESAPTTTCTITIPTTDDLGRPIVADLDCYLSIISRGHTSATALCSVVDDEPGGNAWAFEISEDTRKTQLFWRKTTPGTAGRTITISGGLTSLGAVLTIYRGGYYGGDPTTDATFEINNAPDKSHAGITPSFADSMVCLSIGDQSADVSILTITGTSPATLVVQAEYLNAVGSGSTITHASAAQIGAPVATGTFTWTMQSNQSTKSLLWAIRPQLTQDVGPSADITDGAWTNEAGSNANLFASVDESTANDADYIQSSDKPTNDVVELKMPTIPTPPPGPGTLYIRHARS
jgi:hypothetical protein